MPDDYRARIYSAYLTSRQQGIGPKHLAGLSTRAPHLRNLISRHFPRERNAAILDLGCGLGALLHFARLDGYTNIRGVDVSPEQVAEAEALGIDCVQQGDAVLALRDVRDASLDCVVSRDLIEHFDRKELLGLVDEVYRVLKPGGRWIIHTPNAESPLGMRVRYGDFTHEMAFTRTSIGQLLFSSGFSRVDCFEDQPIPHGGKSLVRWMLWKCIRGFLRLYLAAETGNTGRDAIFSQNFLTVALK